MAVSIDRTRLQHLWDRECERFSAHHQRSRQLAEEAGTSLLGGVPMNWMRRWPGPWPVFAAHAEGATVVDVDGNEYADLCLGDTGAMAGHAPGPTVEAVGRQAARGLTTMLPSEDGLWVARELARRFGLPQWQFTLSATDANRFALRIARHLTGRDRIVVFDWCYHGTVDETLAVLDDHGRVVARPGSVGPQVDPAATTEVVQFNDLAALEALLGRGEVAAVVTEPALTNIGIVLPQEGFHQGLRSLTRETGTLLVIDETHTLCAGPGGMTRAAGLEPDLITVGKAIGGGVPVGAFGMTAEVAARVRPSVVEADEADVSGIGGTLAGNALSLAATRATLSQVLTDESWGRTSTLASRWTEGVAAEVERHGLDWTVRSLGCRAEYWFCAPPQDGRQAAAATDHRLEAYLHLHALNRGILLTPFHNMALMCPATTAAMVDRHRAQLAEALDALVGDRAPS